MKIRVSLLQHGGPRILGWDNVKNNKLIPQMKAHSPLLILFNDMVDI